MLLFRDGYRYFEDYRVGEEGTTAGLEYGSRTITEADFVNFAGLSADYNPQYVDARFAGNTVFGERIAPGLLVFNVVFGPFVRDRQYYRRPYNDFGAHIGDRGMFTALVKIGDTIRCRYRTPTS